MTSLRQRMINDMTVRGLAENTKKSYLSSVTGLACLTPAAGGTARVLAPGIRTPSRFARSRTRHHWRSMKHIHPPFFRPWITQGLPSSRGMPASSLTVSGDAGEESGGCYAFGGSIIISVNSPTSVSTRMWPPCWRTMSLESARPRPTRHPAVHRRNSKAIRRRRPGIHAGNHPKGMENIP